MKNLIGASLIAIVAATSASAGNRHHNDSGAAIAGAIVGIIVGQALANDHRGQARPQHRRRHTPSHNPYNNPRLPGYTRGYESQYQVCSSTAERRRYETIVREYNCYGEMLGMRTIPRY